MKARSFTDSKGSLIILGLAATVASGTACGESASSGGTGNVAGTGGTAGNPTPDGGADARGSTGGSGGTNGSGGSGGTNGSGGSAPAGFECVGKVTWPAAPKPSVDGSFTFFHGEKALDGVPFEGVNIDVCADTECATPLDSAVTGATGKVTLTLPTGGTGFDGYLHGSGPEIVPLFWTFRPPIADAGSRWLRSDWKPAVFTNASWAAVGSDLGRTLDATKGHVITTAIDCNGEFSATVTTTVNGAAPVWRGGAAGEDALFFDVVPGDAEIVGSLDATGAVIGRVHATVRAGSITAVHFGPMPVP